MVNKWQLGQATSKYWGNSQELGEACELHCGGKSKRDGSITGAGMSFIVQERPAERYAILRAQRAI